MERVQRLEVYAQTVIVSKHSHMLISNEMELIRRVSRLVFVDVLSIDELKPGEMRQVKAESKRILVVNVDGKLYAIGDVCTHEGCGLSSGSLEGENVRCPCHGSMFNVKTGSVFRGPAKKPEPVFEIKTEDGRVFINL